MTLKALAVFAALFALDFVWVKYTNAMVGEKAISAGVYAAAIIILSGSAVVGYAHDPWLLIPAGLGAFLGTVSAMKLRFGKL